MGIFTALFAIREVYRDVRTMVKIAKMSAKVVAGGLCTLAEILSAMSDGHFGTLLTRLLVRAPPPRQYLKTTNRHVSLSV